MKDPHHQPVSPVDYQKLFRQLPGRILLLRPNDPEFTIVEMTDSYAVLTGFTRQKALGKGLLQAFPAVKDKYSEAGVQDLARSIRKVIRSKEPDTTQRILHFRVARPKNGEPAERYWRVTSYPVLDDTQKLIYVLQRADDATVEMAISEQLAQVQMSMEDALEIGKVGSWVWDLAEDRIVADKNLAKMFGLWPRQAAVGVSLQEFLSGVHAADRSRVERAIKQVRTKGLPFDEEYRTHTPEGETRWVIARGRVKQRLERRVFSGVLVDVTERRDLQLQIELARQQDKMNRQEAKILQRRNDELEAIGRTKDEFVALASHQLRTPATAVKQYLGMVLQGYVGNVSPLQADVLEKAFESNERQIKIINQILNAARVDTGRLIMSPVPVDLRTLALGISEEMRSEIEQKQHRLDVVLPKQAVPIVADLSYLRMAIENVLHNASIYTPPGGQVHIELRKLRSQARLSITDNGVGIKKADLSKLFAKFSRIHNPLSVAAGGSGIGLYLTAEIVRLHGGSVEVTSKISHGTTFAISLPLAQNKIQSEDTK